MASNAEPTQVPTPKPEPTPTEKPTAPKDSDKRPTDCTCEPGMPKLARRDSIDSVNSIIDLDYRPPPRRVPQPMPYRNRSPIRNRPIVYHNDWVSLNTSTNLLEQVGKHDGMVSVPFPARGDVYLTTFPFTDKDVKKWSWLFSLGVEEQFLERGRGRGRDLEADDDDAANPVVRRARNRSPYYDPLTVDIPSVYLSRALDAEVVPEDTKSVKYLIVTQNRHRLAGSKLLVAESRKAAAIIMFYEVYKGDSIMFVGATTGLGEKKVLPKNFRKVDSLEECEKLKEEGIVGVVC